MTRWSFQARDGKAISVLEWNDVASPVGVLQISHGMAEHAGRYDAFARYMNERGVIVFCDDHRAHGETSPEIPGYEDGDIFADTLGDLRELTVFYREKYGLPVVLFGHSYGSFLTQAYLEKYSDLLAGAIVGGSSYMKNPSVYAGSVVAAIGCAFKGKKAPAKLLAKMSFDAYEKKLGGSSFISSVPEEAERYKTDPKCGFICSYAFYKYFFKAMKKLYKKSALASVKVPVLFIAGCNDPVGDFAKGMEKVEGVYAANGVKTSLILQEGVRHEYLNDVKKDEAADAIATFTLNCIKAETEKRLAADAKRLETAENEGK